MTKMYNNLSRIFLAGLLLFTLGCERDLEELELAPAPTNGDVFIDGFTGGLEYAAFANADVLAFQVDEDVAYAGTASMRFAVPDFEDPAGAFAGGAFFLEAGRDLSGFNVLTFWARASQPANIDQLGFGNNFADNPYITFISEVPVNTNWKKYYVPIPDPSKLTNERGMFFFSEGNENGRGYTFWIDEVKFENLGTIGETTGGIFNGEDLEVTTETGATFNADGFFTANLPTGVDQRVNAAPAYFTYSSSDATVATVNQSGQVTVLDAGSASITATLGGAESKGSLQITSTGEAVGPDGPAPTPEVPEEDVISLFSNAYTNEPVDYYNGFWLGSNTQSEIVQVDGDDVIRYSQLDFVGIQFTSPTIDATSANRIHLDIWTPDGTDPPAAFKILLVDLGPDGSFDGEDNSSHEMT
ncbi:MAG: Ig-like domain-containing protein, partial [Bacteroidota bacterium]